MSTSRELTPDEQREFDRRDATDPRGGAAIRDSVSSGEGVSPDSSAQQHADMAYSLTRREIGVEQAREIVQRIGSGREVSAEEVAARRQADGDRLIELLRRTNPGDLPKPSDN